ncbi:hypothetical protein SDC9_115811 [bioreactor metagenome]|uniref:Uncharacterized protein n=1 Tax=bioreactor metagenome TaxID=1076179 RepID=A0A645BU31_9ZZZZ
MMVPAMAPTERIGMKMPPGTPLPKLKDVKNTLERRIRAAKPMEKVI